MPLEETRHREMDRAQWEKVQREQTAAAFGQTWAQRKGRRFCGIRKEWLQGSKHKRKGSS